MRHKLILIYTIPLTLWFAANRLILDGWWVLVILNIIASFFFWPAVPLFILSLTTKKWKTIGIALIPLLIFGFFYGRNFRPTYSENKRPSSFRLMTYNILNQNIQWDKVADNIKQYAPDAVAIQELMAYQIDPFVAEMSDEYPHYFIGEDHKGGTTAVFSRHPFTATTELDFGVQRPTIITKLTLAGEEVVFVSAHFNPTYYALKQTPKPQRTQAIQQYILDQNSEAAQLITHLQTNHPDSIVVVGCDCNSYTTSSTNPILDSYLTDPVHTLGIPLNQSAPEGTSHEIRPRRIDYLWYRGDVKPIGIYRVKETAGSDHNPILAEFILD